MTDSPLATLALPLYKSHRFLDIIIGNLDTIAYPNLEFLISDRHCADDTIDVLQARYGNDPRFKFLRARDEIGWVEHYNVLLRAARGKYFLWMPHDDTYPANYVTVLARTLENARDAIAAYGDMQGLGSDGPPNWVQANPPFSPNAPWTARDALALFLDGRLCLVMRGLFRREWLIQANLFLHPTRENNAADMVWLFAVACSGRLVWTPDTQCQKRYYKTSTHAGWKPRTWRNTLSEIAALRAELVENQTSLRAGLRGWLLVLAWGGFRLGRNALDATNTDMNLEPRIRHLLRQFVRPARG